jgi:hypothetical protein
MSLAKSSAPLTLGDPGSLLKPIFILMGSAAKLPVEKTNRKTRAKMLVQMKRNDVFFMDYLLIVLLLLDRFN